MHGKDGEEGEEIKLLVDQVPFGVFTIHLPYTTQVFHFNKQ